MGGRRFWVANGILLAVVGVVAYFGLSSLFHTASAHAAQRTATVQLGTVSQTVTASGNISPAQSENVSFATGGTVTTINVSVGQRVAAGQTLATLDTGPAQAALTAAEDNLSAAQDNLALAQSGNETPPQIQQDDAVLAADQSAVNTAQATLTADQAQLATYQAECSSSASASATSTGSAGRTGGSTTSPPSSSTSSSTGTTSGSSPCQLATSEQQTVNQDQNSLTQSQNALAQQNLAIAAKRYVNPAVILQDEAQVTSAQETVTQDQRTLAETTLTAPFDGTVTAVNGTLGQTVSGGGNAGVASSGATGGSAGAGAGGSGGTGGNGGSAGAGAGTAASATSSSSSSSSGSSSGFITIANLSNLEVVAGFPEASAVKVKVGQPATVTLSATNATASGTVTAIDPTPSVVSNVVTYQVTVTLQNPPASVQDGMSATVAVVVASADNALELPSSAITTTGRASTVELLKNGKQVLTPITVGLVGDSTTQILSGLSAGDTVVEPSVTVSSSGGSTTGAGGRLGGLFGGFGGGGGGGAGGGAVGRGG